MPDDVSTFRLYLLRAMYLLIIVGLGFTIWPGVIRHAESTPWANGVVSSLLAGVSVLALLGLRYPLKMLPLLLFELIWKLIWLLAFALPLWRAGQMNPETAASVKDCLFGIILVPIVVPWPYVWAHYIRKAGDRWK
ncbi:MAG TPA: hypothetical protein VNL73_07640 [Verrucomicrobiae bacterium]|nr:hypothetical protein [Verrucomicrobiae bacterium]